MTIGSSVTITGLETDTKYQFFAISRNQFGTSLPTSLISVNVSRAAWNGQKVTGKPSAPHGIELVKGGFISESIFISIRLIKLMLNQFVISSNKSDFSFYGKRYLFANVKNICHLI